MLNKSRKNWRKNGVTMIKYDRDLFQQTLRAERECDGIEQTYSWRDAHGKMGIQDN